MQQIVNIQLESDLPPASKIPVILHYRSLEGLISKVIMMSEAVRFDGLIVSTVSKTIGPLPPPDISVDSIRNWARWIYHGTRTSALSRLVAPARFDSPVFDTRYAEPGNIAHILINILPYCLCAQEVVDTKTVMIFRKMAPLFANLVRHFGIEPVIEPRRVRGDVVTICGTRGLAVYDLITTDEVWPTAFMPNAYEKFDFSRRTSHRKIFLARRGDRALLNNEATAELVQRFGYQTIFMEDYSLEQQLIIGASAQHVVAVHGAAMSFLVMAKRIESVIELLPNHNYIEYFPVSLGTRVAHYEQIISSFDKTMGHRGWSTLLYHKTQPFEVDLVLLAQRLSLLN